MTLMKLLAAKSGVHLQLSDGHIIRGKMHPFWVGSIGRARPVIKTLVLNPLTNNWHSVRMTRGSAWSALRTLPRVRFGASLPRGLLFGAVASVGRFNRVARLLQRILREALILGLNYFDDYPLLDLGSLSESTDRLARNIFDLGLYSGTGGFDA